MSIHFFRPLLCMGWVVAVPMALAQTAAVGVASEGPASRAVSLQAPVPLTFQSVMTDYRPYHDQPVGSWAEANRTVEQLGGWRAYAREASQPEDRPAPAADDKGGKP